MTGRRIAAPGRPTRAGLYVRVSALNGRAGDRFHSPDLQLEAMRSYITRRGLVEVATFTDLDRTGRSFEREGITAAFEAAKAGTIEALVVLDLSRFGRNTGESLRNIAELRDLGVSVVSTTEQIDDTPEGQFMLGQFLGMAQLYSDQIGRRWGQIHTRRHEQGLVHAGKVPLGYVLEGGRAVVDPVLGPLITWAFRSYLAGTVSQKAIAERLTQARGRLVRQGTVSNLLRNPFHAGQVVFRGERRTGVHDPLVTVKVFEAVQRKLARDLVVAPRVRVPLSFSAGMVACGACEQTLHRRGRGPAGEDGTLRPRLRCPTAGCVGVGAPFVADVEAALLAEALRVAGTYRDGTAAVVARQQQATVSRADEKRLRAEHRQLVKEVDRAGKKLLADVLADEDYRRLVDPLKDRLGVLVERIGLLEDAPVRRPIAELRDAAQRLEQLRRAGMTVLEMRTAVLFFVAGAWLDPAAYRGQPVAERMRYPD